MARRRRKPVPSKAIEKALPATTAPATVSGRVYTAEQVQGLLNRQQETGALAQPLPRDQYPYAFGPGIPLTPAPLDPTRRSSGRAEPRLWEYPVSWNLPGTGHGRLVPWKTLRDAANLPLIRDCLRIRKSEIQGLEWDFGLSRRAIDRAQRDQPDAGRLDVERELRGTMLTDIDRCTDFWLDPDPGNGYTFAEWICQFLEEQLVLDALAIYPRYTLGGDLYSLEILDSTTIKPLLDHRGGRPMPPEPAYQQIIHGFPRGEFTADTSDTEGRTVVPDAYTADQLIYIRREVRAHTPYGLSPVEQSLMDIDLWHKRINWLRAEYTDGVMPAGWLINEQTSTHQWSPGQVAEYERELNDHYSGQTANRFRYRVLPPGFRPEESGPNVAEKYKPEFDMHLLKLVVAHFDLTVHELGFTEAKGLGSDGHAEGQDRLNNRKGRKPALRWMAELITQISRAHLKLPRELEFKWLGIDDEGEGEEEDKTAEQVAAGLLTINEGRDEIGRPRFTFPEADKPAVINGATITFIEGAEERAEAALQLEERAVDAKAEPGGAPGGSGGKKPAAPARSASSATGGSGAKKAAEASAYRKWLAKGRTGRRFQLEYIVEPADLVQFDIDPARVTYGADLGKAPAPERGELDQITERVARQLNEAALGAVDCDELATAWREHMNAEKGLRDLARVALGWLLERAAPLAGRLRPVLASALTEAWRAGEHDALDAIGDDARSPAAERLEMLLDAAGVTILSVAASRFAELADVLADAVEDGRSPQSLATDLRGVLDAPQWAETVAVTETARAMSAATQATYERNAIGRKLWLLAPDQRVCKTCAGNAGQGAIPTTSSFESGDAFPPAHPHCRCSLTPVLDLPKKADRNQLKEYWLRGEGAARWTSWTDLYNHLKDHVGNERAKRMAAQWYHDRYGRWPGEKGHDD
ncbi:MAG TPA: minor capsid protein [Pseudonocardia sp.]|uniref:VG15 protein n=1 Tax=Pseudonocardia sp. TaxID=60912 RepID=UPI002CA792B6|nr:minor capsid protein [Pseudonocardia sp.]HTF49383.1 minor capsid protein [Pseudonocardia sp.]